MLLKFLTEMFFIQEDVADSSKRPSQSVDVPPSKLDKRLQVGICVINVVKIYKIISVIPLLMATSDLL